MPGAPLPSPGGGPGAGGGAHPDHHHGGLLPAVQPQHGARAGPPVAARLRRAMWPALLEQMGTSLPLPVAFCGDPVHWVTL